MLFNIMVEVKQISALMDIPKKLANTLLEDNQWNIDRVIKNYKYMKEATCKLTKNNKNTNLETNERQLRNSVNPSDNGYSNQGTLLMIPKIIITEEQNPLFENNVFNNLVLNSLQKEGKLNWWVENGCGPKLYPLICEKIELSLFESISIACWGSCDYIDAIGQLIKNHFKDSTFKNVIFNQWMKDNLNLIPNLDVDIKRWEILIITYINHLTGIDNSFVETHYNIESLVIFLLSHALQRPILIISNDELTNGYQTSLPDDNAQTETNNDAIRNPIVMDINIPQCQASKSKRDTIEGLYLPMNLNADCTKSAVLIAYFAGCYYALAPMEECGSTNGIVYKTLLPIVKRDKNLFKIHYANEKNAVNDEQDKTNYFNVLEKYLEIEYSQNKIQHSDTNQQILEGMVWNNCGSVLIESPKSKKYKNMRRKIGKSFSSLRRSINFFLNHADEPMTKNNDSTSGYDITGGIPCMCCSFSRIHEYDSILLYRLEVAAALRDNHLREDSISDSAPLAVTCHKNSLGKIGVYCNGEGSNIIHRDSCTLHGSSHFSRDVDPFKLKSKEPGNKFCVKNAQLRRLQFTQSKSEDGGYRAQTCLPSTSSNNEDVRRDCPLNNSVTNLGGKSLDNIKSLDNLHCKVHNNLTQFSLQDYLSEEMVRVVGSEVSVIGSEVFEKGKEFVAADSANENCFVNKLVQKNGCE